MRLFPATVRGQIITAFSACFLFMALMMAINYSHFNRLNSSLQFFATAKELHSTLLEMRRYEKNFLLYQKGQDLEENLAYTKRLALILQREQHDLIRSLGKENFDRFLKYQGAYASLLVRLRESPSTPRLGLDLQAEIRTNGQLLLAFADQLLLNERRGINQPLSRMAAFPLIQMVFLLILLGWVVFFISKNLLRPLTRIARESEAMAQGIFKGNLSSFGDSDNEIHRLIGALNRMMSESEIRQEQVIQSRKIAAVGSLASGIAHEINNPLNNIVLTLESLIEDYQILEAGERLQLYQEALDQTERAADIVKNLLEFSQTNHPQVEELSLEDLIDKTVRLLHNEFKKHRIKVFKEVRVSMPRFRLDKSGLQQVLVNLLLNSVQAMPEGGEIKVILEQVRNEARIGVTDTGIGIPPENLGRIFDPFFSTRKGGEGTGLGLTVSYSIMAEQGGRIEVQSTAGQGSTFSLYLPASVER